MSKSGKSKRGRKSKAARWRGYAWAGVPDKGTNASWDLFLACGQAVLQALDSPRPGPWRGDIRTPLLDLLELEGHSVVAKDAENSAAPKQTGVDSPASAENAEAPLPVLPGRHVHQKHTEEKSAVLSRAIELLTKNPCVTFPFLAVPGALAPPPHAALLTAVFCARYVLEGVASPLENLRPMLALFDRLPHEWVVLGKSLACYCRRKESWIKLLVQSDAPSALDGAIILSARAYRDLLGIEPPQEQADGQWMGDSFSERLRRRRDFRSPARPRPRRRKEVDDEPRMAHLTRPKLGLDDLLLPRPLKQELQLAACLCKRKASAAPTLLFHGAPGTGKTHAASAFAGAVGRRLATASLAQLQDKYVGETEKHLEQIFKEAAKAKAILLLDEADALLNSREQAQRSWEVSWVNALLKLLEKPGVPVILCTNFVDKLDPAVHRRIHQMLTFPIPGADERRGIWERELRLARLKTDADLERLAQVPISGGLIANAVRQAKVRRDILGRAFTVTTASLLELAQAEQPKMLGTGGGERRAVGFGAQRELI